MKFILASKVQVLGIIWDLFQFNRLSKHLVCYSIEIIHQFKDDKDE